MCALIIIGEAGNRCARRDDVIYSALGVGGDRTGSIGKSDGTAAAGNAAAPVAAGGPIQVGASPAPGALPVGQLNHRGRQNQSGGKASSSVGGEWGEWLFHSDLVLREAKRG